jgi:hypothetical protein
LILPDIELTFDGSTCIFWEFSDDVAKAESKIRGNTHRLPALRASRRMIPISKGFDRDTLTPLAIPE